MNKPRISLFILVSLLLLSAKVWSQNFTKPLLVPDTLSNYNSPYIHLTMDDTSRQFFFVANPNPMTHQDSVTAIVGWPDSTHVFPQDTMPIPTNCFNSPGHPKGNILGPTLIWHKNKPANITVKNNLQDTATVHWHGAHIPAWCDGGPHQPIAPGTTWNPYFNVLDDETTLWYHPHLHMETQRQVQKGLAGMIIVRDLSDPLSTQLPHTYGKDDFPLVLQDKEFQRHGTKDSINITCSMGTSLMVNGTIEPYLNVPDHLVRFRILDGSSERAWQLKIVGANGVVKPVKIIASDAGYLKQPYTTDSVFIAPGERYEIAVDLTGAANKDFFLVNFPNQLPDSAAGGKTYNDPGCYIAGDSVSNGHGGKYPFSNFDSIPHQLMKIHVQSDNTYPYVSALPPTLKTYVMPPHWKTPDVTRIKRFVFSTDTMFYYNNHQDSINVHGGPPFQIADQYGSNIDTLPFIHDYINDTVYLNNTEAWTIINTTGVGHPFHIHDISFFIVSINGDTLIPAPLSGPKDVMYVDAHDTITFVTQFTDFATGIEHDSAYMYHCHILAHEDHGMMHQFVVVNAHTVGISQEKDWYEWRLFPNPTASNITIYGACHSNSHLNIFNAQGVLARSISLPAFEGSKEINIQELPAGMWFIRWNRPDGISTKRMVKTR